MGSFKVRALIVSMGPVQIGADTRLQRHRANVIGPGTGDTFQIGTGTAASGTESKLVVPHSTAVGTGTAVLTLNGQIMITQKGVGTPALAFRMNGTNYLCVGTAA